MNNSKFKNKNIQNHAITTIELFAGIGSARKALQNSKIKNQPLFFSEIDKNVEQVYRSIFNDHTTVNLGDIKKIMEENIKEFIGKCDLLIFGSPCQDFSHAGKNKGGKFNSNTRSSLLWEAVRIIKIIKPKIIIFENVKNLWTNLTHRGNLELYLAELKKNNYCNNAPIILNSKHYGIPQNRERLFAISFYQNKLLCKKAALVDWLQERIQSPQLQSMLVEKEFANRKCLLQKIEHRHFTNFNTWTDKKGNKNGSYNRAWKVDKYCGALSYCNVIKITDGINVSKITPKESFRLMGFTDSDYNAAIDTKVRHQKILQMAGNSIVVNVLMVIFKNVLL